MIIAGGALASIGVVTLVVGAIITIADSRKQSSNNNYYYLRWDHL